jgi:glucan phosphoethanolaminetransferase (alkaline phosphatase superfamily)
LNGVEPSFKVRTVESLDIELIFFCFGVFREAIIDVAHKLGEFPRVITIISVVTVITVVTVVIIVAVIIVISIIAIISIIIVIAIILWIPTGTSVVEANIFEGNFGAVAISSRLRARVLALEVSILYLCVIPGSEYEGHVSLDVLVEDIKIVFTVSLHNHLALISEFVLLQGSAKLP